MIVGLCHGWLNRTVPLDELRTAIARQARRGDPPIDGVLLSCVDRPSAPSASIADPVLALVAQGAKRLTLGDRIYDYGAGQYLVVSVDLPVTGYYRKASPTKPFLGFGLTLRPAAIASLLLETGRGTTGRATPTPPGIAVSTASPDLLDAVVRMLRLLDHPADIPVLAPMIEKEILWRLITGDQGAMVRQIGLADSRLSHIGRAIQWIRDHHADLIRIDDLAALSAMSVSAFHRHFRAVTAMTPIQYQKRIRLQEARLRLLSGPPEVSTVGFAVGYDSPSQFSREYRRQFGAPPGQDIARLRRQTETVDTGPSTL